MHVSWVLTTRSGDRGISFVGETPPHTGRAGGKWHLRWFSSLDSYDPYEWKAAAIRRTVLARDLRAIFTRTRRAKTQTQYDVLNEIADPIMVLDPTLRVVFANRRAEKLALTQSSERRGEPRLLPSLAAELGTQIPAGRDPAEPARFEWCHADSGLRFEGSVTGDDGLTILQLHDVTVDRRAYDALQTSERRYRELAESSFDVVALFRSDGTLLDANRQWEEVYGYKRDDLIGTTRMRDLLRPTTRAKIAAAMAEASAEPESGPLARYDIDLLDKHGRQRNLEFSFRFFRTPGKQSLIQVVGRDVTERQELADRLQRSQKLEALGRLAGGVAHDFNNVLLVVRGAAALLRAGTQSEGALELIDEIDRESDRARGLVRQLLAYARRQVVQPEVLDLTATISEMERMLSRLVGESIALRIEVREDTQHVLGDRSTLEQVLLNLVVNARDAIVETGSDTGTITIATYPHRFEADAHPRWGECLPGDYVALSVTDTGIGIDLALEPLIFEPFFSSKGMESSGLGLATVYGIVTQMGGGIDVQSVSGQGSTFTVYLPVTRQAPASATSSHASTQQVDQLASVGATVLLVEDEDGPRRVLQRVLSELGYQVIAVAHPLDAIRLVEDGDAAIDVLLTDVVMPEMSGPQLASQLRAHLPSLPVVFMTGYSEAPLELGSSALLEKPFSSADLAHELARTLNATQQSREDPT
jgi:two-component system cell cycle sensor histidine kinase/response regulator CckA